MKKGQKLKHKIYVACHKDFYIPESEVLFPIQVGAALAPSRFDNMLHDDVGDNISKKNRSYCELTALYWAWKNDDSDYVGLFHYRRFFSFKPASISTEKRRDYVCLSDDKLDLLDINKESLDKFVRDCDFAVAMPNITTDVGVPTVFDQYRVAPHHHIEDFELLLNIIDEKTPDIGATAREFIKGQKVHYYNMFYMRRDIFNSYCEWLFDILTEFDKQKDYSHYTMQAYRLPGYLAERMLSIYYAYMKEKNPDLKTKELQVAMFKSNKDVVKPFSKKNNIPIVLSSSTAFLPFLTVTIKSILLHANPTSYYDFIILNDSIKESDQQKVLTLEDKNVSIRFLDVSLYFAGKKLFLREGKRKIARETYFRLVLQEVLPDYDKVIYLDSDLVIRRNIDELMGVDIEDKLLAAVKEYQQIGLYNSDNVNREAYLKNFLELDDPYGYFQCGVIVMNLKRFREKFTVDEVLKFASAKEWDLVDQDVMNVLCQGEVEYLSARWNYVVTGERLSSLAPACDYFDYLDSKRMPYIIHFAGLDKPWDLLSMNYSWEFWRVAQKTPYYEFLLGRLMDKRDIKLKESITSNIQQRVALIPTSHIKNKKRPSMKGKKPMEKIKILSSYFLPYGTKRREKVKRFYEKHIMKKPWTIRSDFSMHAKIAGRRILKHTGLSFLSKEMRSLKKIKNTHKGERCFVVCTGPSLQIADLERIKGEISFGVNSIVMAYTKTDWRPTYYAMIDLYNLGKFLETNDIEGKEFAQVKAFLHYRGKVKNPSVKNEKCLINYSNHMPSRMKKKVIKVSKDPAVCIYDCFTVTNMAIQLAMYMGFSEIYIMGADCNYDPRKMHFIETEIDNKHRGAKWLPGAVELSILGYKAVKKVADKKGVKIFNATRGGMLEVFPRVDFDKMELKEVN